MPAGDQISEDFQWELRATLMGPGTVVKAHRRKGGIVGLLDTPGRAAETEYAHADGSFIGEASRPPRTATFNLIISASTAAAAGTALAAQEAVWEPGSATEPLYFRFPGIGKKYVNGWPLGIIDVDTTEFVFGVVTFAALFRITDPVIHT